MTDGGQGGWEGVGHQSCWKRASGHLANYARRSDDCVNLLTLHRLSVPVESYHPRGRDRERERERDEVTAPKIIRGSKTD